MSTQKTMSFTRAQRPIANDQVDAAAEAFLGMHTHIRTSADVYTDDTVLARLRREARMIDTDWRTR